MSTLTMTQAAMDQRQEGEPLDLDAIDGYRLGATYYDSPAPVRGHLVVAPAIGVSQRHYRAFASHAAASGWRTLTFDYRGIGRSRSLPLGKLKLDYFDWGRLDLAAAVARMADPRRRLIVVGHSYAGHAFGVLPVPGAVSAFVTFGTGAGWHGWMAPIERLRVLALWHAVAPVLTLTSGYLNWSCLGMGEDLPLSFFRQWRRLCQYPRHFLDDERSAAVAQAFAGVRVPILAANSIDDRWSPPVSRDAFMASYCNASLETRDLDPAALGLPGLGHMGYFRSGAVELWDEALAWAERQPLSSVERFL